MEINNLKKIISEELKSNKDFNINEALLEDAKKLSVMAFVQENKEALDSVHTLLNNLLKLEYFIPAAENEAKADLSANIFSVKSIFIKDFLNYLESKFDKMKLYTGGDFKNWWNTTISNLEECPHNVFKYLAEKGTDVELKEFIRQDATVHVPFHDSLALMQVGTRGEVKDEFFENFSDEVGHGGEDKEDHMIMFDHMIQELKIDATNIDAVSWQAKACGNLLMILSLYRSLYHVGIGYMGCVESLTPGRFKHIVQAGRRLGYTDEILDFYIEHSECDTEHAQGWVDHVIMPTINKNPATAENISKGLLYRLTISEIFWSKIEGGFKQADEKRAA